MTDDVVMSRSGIRALIRLTREQHEHHRAIWSFTREQGLYEGHWFDKGFLSLFRGDYDAATDDVFMSMSEASTGTHRLAERIDHSRQLLDHADRSVEITMVGLQEVNEAVQVPTPLKGYGGLTNYGGIEQPTGKHRGPRTYGSAADTIDAVSSIASAAHHTDQVVDGITTDDELEDFVEEHQEDVDE